MMDPVTLGQLVDEHAAALVLYARQWCAAPEDVVQDAFVKLAQQRTPPERVVPWLYRVVRNGAISVLRSLLRRRRHETEAAAERAGWFATDPTRTVEIHPDEAVRALQTLPEIQREVITLRLWGGLTFAEVAEVLETSSSTVHRWYEQGLTLLRQRLDVTPCPKKT